MFSRLLIFTIIAIFFKEGQFFKLPSNKNSFKDDAPRLEIVHGQIGNSRQFPYQVSLFGILEEIKISDTTSSYRGKSCGGSIANQLWIVTAAHCVVEKGVKLEADKVLTRVGIDSLDDENVNNPDHVYLAEEIYVHPSYNNETLNNDIALIKLERPIKMADNVQPVCFDLTDRVHQYYIASGYGTVSPKIETSDGESIQEPQKGNELKYAFFVENRNQCKSNIFVCIDPYDKNSGDSVCMGDSGGPLTTSEKRVIGVSSNVLGKEIGSNRVEFCNGKGQYTRLSSHIDYLDSHIGKNSYCSIRYK